MNMLTYFFNAVGMSEACQGGLRAPFKAILPEIRLQVY